MISTNDIAKLEELSIRIIWIIIIIIVLLFFTVIFYKPLEKFRAEIRRLIVTPSPSVYSNNSLYTWYPKSMVYQLGNNIQKLYPIQRVLPGDKSLETIRRVSKDVFAMGLVSECVIKQFINMSNTTHPRPIQFSIVGSIGHEQLTFLFPIQLTLTSIRSHLENPAIRIGIPSKTDPAYYILQTILTLYKVPISVIREKIVEVEFQVSAVRNAFDSNDIQIYTSLATHPNDIVGEIIRDMGKNMTVRGVTLQSNEQTILFPLSTVRTLSLRDYGLIDSEMSLSVKTLEFPLLLIANSQYPKDDISRFFYTLFTKSAWIKQQGDSTYIEQMKSWNASELFNILKYDTLLHPAIRQIMIENGYISNY